MSLLDHPSIYKPFYYPWAYDAWIRQQKMHWLAEEIDLGEDVRDWVQVLRDSERNLLTQIFRFFTQADVEVNNCYMRQYARVFKPVEIQMMLTAFANMETIHIQAYSYLLDTIGMPETEYSAFLNYKEMRDKYEYMQKFNMDNPKNIALTMAAFGAFTEGLQLFASFAILLNFPRFGKMKGMGQIVSFSVRDETLHTLSIIRLFKEFLTENPQINVSTLNQELTEICHNMVQHEEAFIDLAFECGDMEGLGKEEVKQYVRFIADRRLKQLGAQPIYLIKNHPLPWIDALTAGIEHTNFFENRATEYAKSASLGTWDDSFNFINKENYQKYTKPPLGENK